MTRATSNLVGTFLAVVDDPPRDAPPLEPEARGSLGSALVGALDAAHARWPDLASDDDAFVRFLAERVPVNEQRPEATFERVRVEDLYLAHACVLGSDGAAEAFERTVMTEVPKVVARVDRTATFVDELVALVRIKLLVGDGTRPPAVASYIGHGPLTAFAQVVATREALSAKRKRSKEDPVDRESLLRLPMDHDHADPELDEIKRQVEAPFRRAFRAAIDDLDRRSRNVLRLYLVEGVGSEAIAKMYGVHRATVARWVSDAREAVFKGTRKRMIRELQIGSASFASLMGKLATQLDVTLTSFLDGED